jgi:type IV secretory pathway VirJ component
MKLRLVPSWRFTRHLRTHGVKRICRALLGSIALAVAPCVMHAQADADIKGLPLNWTAPKGTHSHYVAIMLTGDGGFADLFTKVADELAAQGIGVAGFNSRSWLSPKKSPDQTAAAVSRVIRAAMQRYGGDSVVIVGYSRGADMAPFVASRLDEPLRRVLGGVAMIGLGTKASFEYHFTDLFKDTVRPEDIPILPELEKLRGLNIACVYGSDEKSSACRDAPVGLLHVDEREGGHHLDGDYKALGEWVLKLIGHSPARTAP